MNRQEIISRLEKAREYFEARADMAVGEGKMLLLSWANAQRDAIDLLAAQEQVEPRIDENKNGVWIFCPKCQWRINVLNRYCSNCGRRLKWEDLLSWKPEAIAEMKKEAGSAGTAGTD